MHYFKGAREHRSPGGSIEAGRQQAGGRTLMDKHL